MKNNFREWYSWSVVASVASAAGLVCQVPVIDVNKADVMISTLGLWHGRVRSVSLQLKASSDVGTAREKGVDYVTQVLKRDYYDEMQQESTVPLFLVLVALPPLESPWTRVRQNIHALHAAAWWGAVTDPPNGKESQTVRIPASQRLDVVGLRTMLELA